MTARSESTQPADQPGAQRRAEDDEVAALYVEHRDGIRLFLRAHGCAAAEAEDIAHDTILIVRRNWQRVCVYEKPAAYWYKISLHRLRKIRKNRSPEVLSGDPMLGLPQLAEPENTIASVNERDELRALMQMLPARQLQVVWLRHVADLSEADTADILSISKGTVKSQLHDGMERLRMLVTQRLKLEKEVGRDGS